MKRIMSIVIFVAMFFANCKEPSTEQNVYEENFGGITFGITKDEVITVLGRDPDHEYEFENKDGYGIKYNSQIFFDVATYNVSYHFDENDTLYCIWAYYTSYDESEKEQMLIDLDHVKEELSEYYPENTLTRVDEMDNDLFLFTESRVIWLRTQDNSFDVAIMVTE